MSAFSRVLTAIDRTASGHYLILNRNRTWHPIRLSYHRRNACGVCAGVQNESKSPCNRYLDAAERTQHCVHDAWFFECGGTSTRRRCLRRTLARRLRGAAEAVRPPPVTTSLSLASPTWASAPEPDILRQRRGRAHKGGGGIIGAPDGVDSQMIVRERLDDHPPAVRIERATSMRGMASRLPISPTTTVQQLGSCALSQNAAPPRFFIDHGKKTTLTGSREGPC